MGFRLNLKLDLLRRRRRAASWGIARVRLADGRTIELDRAFYLARYPDVARSGIDAARHYVTYGSKEGRLPNAAVELSPWFDERYYTELYPDVAGYPGGAFRHFMQHGLREMRRPNPYFDPGYYIARNRDVAHSGLDALTHYARIGERELRIASPWFDAAFYRERYKDLEHWPSSVLHFMQKGAREHRTPIRGFEPDYYLAENPEVVRSGLGAFEHFCRVGAGKGLNPSPDFDAEFYAAHHPEAIAGGMTPQAHWLHRGLALGFATHPTYDEADYLPVQAKPSARQPASARVAVIIPVYRGLDETRRCIESVLAARCRTEHRVLVINDASPEPALVEYLSALGASAAVELFHNEFNLGFVKTANRGMRLARDWDIVLLNSDTEVAGDWLDRFARQAYSRPTVGTVTPMSNSATICSYPTIRGTRELPAGESAASVDRAFAEVNAGRAVDIPTAVGFCMYIRRDCLGQIGPFDEAAFGRGYGEENDFCLRATTLGWQHLLAADIFVYHAGEVSFGSAAGPDKARAYKIVTERYPHYGSSVHRHVSADPARAFRIAARAGLCRRSGRPVVLIVTHAMGGGTEAHIGDLLRHFHGQVEFLVLRPDKAEHAPSGYGRRVVLSMLPGETAFDLTLDAERDFCFLAEIVASAGVTRLHFHHVLYLPLEAKRLVAALGVPYDFTVHDYYAICPQIQLTTAEGRYCGEPAIEDCNACIAKRSGHGARDIVWWRKSFEWLVRGAEQVICPSADVADRLRKYFPTAHLAVAPHRLVRPEPVQPVKVMKLREREPLRVAILGVLARHKGAAIVEACAELAAKRSAPVEFHAIGPVVDATRISEQAKLRVTGAYKDEELQSLIAEVAPHVIWFPAQWPETYSFTLSAALEAGLPVVAPRLGAFVERLEGRPWTWIVDWEASPASTLDLFERIRAECFATGIAPPVATRSRDADRRNPYASLYAASCDFTLGGRLHATRRPGQRTVLAVIDTNKVSRPGAIVSGPDPCAYIRVILPLLHASVAPLIDLVPVEPTDVSKYPCDAVIVHRTAVADGASADAIIRDVRAAGTRLIYDLDDDLFAIPASHPDFTRYQPRQEAAFRLLVAADRVLVSTADLGRRISNWNPNVEIVENALDETIWGDPRDYQRKSPNDGPVRILYMGTLTHLDDLRLVNDAAAAVKREFADSVEIDIVGVASPRADWGHLRFVAMPETAFDAYPAFVEWLTRSNNWDIGIAPLADTAFNRCKSGIKYMDYAALGLAVVASNLEPYRGVIRSEENGLLVDNTTNAWTEAMRRVISDTGLRRRLQRAAFADLRARHTLSAQAENRRALWSRVLAAPGATGSGTVIASSSPAIALQARAVEG